MQENIISSINAALNGPIRLKTELANNGKSSVWLAELGDQAVVIKTIITSSEFFQDTFKKELAIYEAFLNGEQPKVAPKVLLTGSEPPFLVLEYLPFERFSNERYPSLEAWQRIDAVSILRIVEELRVYSSWPLGSREEVWRRYEQRWQKYLARGVFQEKDAAILDALRDDCGWKPEFNHGDPVPYNILVDRGDMRLIDWEFAGPFVPHYDSAVLWAIALRAPEVQELIERRFRKAPFSEQLSFAANVLNVTSRELWIHKELPEGHRDKGERLSFLEPLLQKARAIVDAVLR